MKKFIKIFIIFIFGLLISLEILIRTRHLTYEVPERQIDEHGIQKYLPNQHGYWINGTHDWIINSLGWPGPLPESYDNLITTVGNSHIENFMNPVECRQSVLLKEQLPQYNFLEASISGMPFIEMIRVAESLEEYNPKMQLLYVKTPDFINSISNLSVKPDITQIDTVTWEVIPSELKSPGIKKVLYSSKLGFYVFNEGRKRMSQLKKKTKKDGPEEVEKETEFVRDSILYVENRDIIDKMLNQVAEKYDTKGFTLVFLPNTNAELVESASKYFNVYKFDSIYTHRWKSGPNDLYHWSCEGHKESAVILSKEIPALLEKAAKID